MSFQCRLWCGRKSGEDENGNGSLGKEMGRAYKETINGLRKSDRDIEEANLVVHEGSSKEIVNKITKEWHAAYKISIFRGWFRERER